MVGVNVSIEEIEMAPDDKTIKNAPNKKVTKKSSHKKTAHGADIEAPPTTKTQHTEEQNNKEAAKRPKPNLFSQQGIYKAARKVVTYPFKLVFRMVAMLGVYNYTTAKTKIPAHLVLKTNEQLLTPVNPSPSTKLKTGSGRELSADLSSTAFQDSKRMSSARQSATTRLKPGTTIADIQQWFQTMREQIFVKEDQAHEAINTRYSGPNNAFKRRILHTEQTESRRKQLHDLQDNYYSNIVSRLKTLRGKLISTSTTQTVSAKEKASMTHELSLGDNLLKKLEDKKDQKKSDYRVKTNKLNSKPTIEDIKNQYKKKKEEIVIGTKKSQTEIHTDRANSNDVYKKKVLDTTQSEQQREKLHLLATRYQTDLVSRLSTLLGLNHHKKYELRETNTDVTQPKPGIVYVSNLGQNGGLKYTVAQGDRVIVDTIKPKQLVEHGISTPIRNKTMMQQLERQLTALLNITSERGHTEKNSVSDVKKAYKRRKINKDTEDELSDGIHLLDTSEKVLEVHRQRPEARKTQAESIPTKSQDSGVLNTATQYFTRRAHSGSRGQAAEHKNLNSQQAISTSNTKTNTTKEKTSNSDYGVKTTRLASESASFDEINNQYKKAEKEISGQQPEKLHQLTTRYQAALVSRLSTLLGLTNKYELREVGKEAIKPEPRIIYVSDLGQNGGIEYTVAQGDRVISDTIKPEQLVENGISTPIRSGTMLQQLKRQMSSFLNITSERGHTEKTSVSDVKEAYERRKINKDTERELFTGIDLLDTSERLLEGAMKNETEEPANLNSQQSLVTETSNASVIEPVAPAKNWVTYFKEQCNNIYMSLPVMPSIFSKKTTTKQDNEEEQETLRENNDDVLQTKTEDNDNVPNNSFYDDLTNYLKSNPHPDGWTAEVVKNDDAYIIEHSDKEGARLYKHDITITKTRVSATVSIKASEKDMQYLAQTMLHIYISSGGKPEKLDLESIKHSGMRKAVELEIEKNKYNQENTDILGASGPGSPGNLI